MRDIVYFRTEPVHPSKATGGGYRYNPDLHNLALHCQTLHNLSLHNLAYEYLALKHLGP
jgi:hypothetical protein